MDNKFLEQLIKCPSPSGAEEQIQKIWKSEVAPYVDEMRTDASGNMIAVINPQSAYKVLLAGHCDEIAFMVKHIDDRGFIYVAAAGGISPKPALGSRVRILGQQAVKGVFAVPPEHKGGAKGELKISELVVDTGANDRESVARHVSVGDYIIYDVDIDYLLDDCITGRALDNRTGAFILAQVMKKLSKKKPSIGVYAAATVNEETNMGGAFFAAATIKPTFGIACDVTFATDDVSSSPTKDGDVKLGEGAVISYGAPINRKINEWIQAVAEKKNHPLQYELTPQRTGTDADAIRMSGEGVPVALVSLPLRYMHSPSEVVSLKDIESEIDLLVDFIMSLTGEENVNPCEL